MTAPIIAPGGQPVSFPEGFVWGAATAAYQIEGATGEDGRGPSIWDTFSRTQGAIADGYTGDTACDHYHRYAGDVRLMKDLGLRAYRFSIAWPRVRPQGAGPVNTAGLDFYERLVDELLAADVSPYVTLYHWDLPQALEDLGGWTNRDTAQRFAEYAQIVHDRLGDRVKTWMTVNEPWVVAFLGYGMDLHAPARNSPADAFRAAHHMLLAHGLATRVLREAGASEIALTLNLAPVVTPGQMNDPDLVLSPEDAEAVERVDCLINRQFLDPALRGRYPAPLLRIVDRVAGLDHIRDGDLAAINQPIDLLGINYYSPCVVRSGPGRPANPAYPGSEDIEFAGAHAPTTASGWPIVPTGLTQLMGRLTRDHPEVGLLVTENGAAFDDVVTGERVHDADRTAFLEGHLRAAYAAIEAGADLRGYLVWSLLDNFEWAEGYTRRFGIVHVDFTTQRRLLKDSALWYRDVIRRNGLHRDRARRPTLDEVAARAGVSRSTVSRVINGQAAVSPEFRQTVMQAVDELGYVPNTAARSLVTRRTDTVALVVLDSMAAKGDDPRFSAIVASAGRALEEAGKQVTLVLADSARSRARVEQHVAGGHVDGVLLVPGRSTDPLPAALARTDIPVVCLGEPSVPMAVPYVRGDDNGGARAAVTHLLERGRRRIAMICGPVDSVAAQERLEGYRGVLRDGDRRSIIAMGEFTLASGAEAMRQLLEDDPDLDAVFAADDLMAIGALGVLHEAGRRVPADVAVVGFGDIEAAAYAVPPLTTVRSPAAVQARTAVRVLLDQLEGRPASSVVLPAELVVRRTT
ncbi:GH1 family beta-glucosidase [Sphaerisporangium fuscum]|uniref:GH1 family beta-glucosidase n=1 Tax=Sphaerisporangium fuscum TaxID=2835868 RepID=UPI001BDC617F|nr:GH1 family beta-glucosidase [Sphaerisporangium fuscum]